MTLSTLATLDELWQSALPRLSVGEQRAGIVLLRELSKGEPVSASQLAQALGTPIGETESLLTDSTLRPFVYAGSDGRVEGFFGLATRPTPHRLIVDGRTLWTWCAQDSLFLPELLGVTARVESRDPETGDLVHLTVSPERIEAVEPEAVTISIVRPDTADLTSAARVIATACHFIFFFADRASGERWVAAHPQTTLLSIDEAFTLGHRQNARLFGQEVARRANAV